MTIDKRRKAVLILECDSSKLSEQGLALGDILQESIITTFPRNPIKLLKAFNLSDLLKDFATLSETNQKYKTVIIIGHSNRLGLQITQDKFLAWSGVAQFLPLFEPNRLIALACEAGKWQACSAMFSSLPTLNEIFASPLPADKTQAMIVAAKAVHVLGPRREDAGLNSFMQIMNFALTGNVMIHHTRKEFEEASEDDIHLWDGVIEPALEMINQLRGNRNV